MKELMLAYSPHNSPPGDKLSFLGAIFDHARDLSYLPNLDNIDAIVLWGGSDISPTLYNAQPILNSGPKEPTIRDVFEWGAMKQALERQIPIIGICRGAQILCAFAGGHLVQHVNGHGGPHHNITTYKQEQFSVTSSHHQMMYPFDVDHEILAYSTMHRSWVYDGLKPEQEKLLKSHQHVEPEVVYFPEVNGMAIQCHPEWHQNYDPFNKWICEQIIDRCFNKVST